MSEEYEKTQAKLRRQHDVVGVGEGSDEEEDDFHIEVPRLPEVNPEVYKDVEPLLFRGFLWQSAMINDTHFVFKSLNHHEFDQLSMLEMGVPASKAAQQRLYSRLMAYGVVMVDGINILPNREQHIPNLMEMFEKLGKTAREKVIFHLSEINRRASRAVILCEAYAMESISRLRWSQTKELDLTSTAVTGLLGTERLGMNWGQLTWRALNYFEDSKDNSEKDWENAKFVASAMAGKGMSKVHSQDRQRRKREMEERGQRKDKILRFAVLGEPIDRDTKRQVIHVARTVEELATQLERDIKGEKDWHDMVVDQYTQQMLDRRQAALTKIREFQAASDEKYGDKALVGQTDFSGMSPEEVQFRIRARRQLAAQRLAAQIDHAEIHDPKIAQFMQKWGQQPASPSGDSSAIGQGSNKARGLPVPVSGGSKR